MRPGPEQDLAGRGRGGAGDEEGLRGGREEGGEEAGTLTWGLWPLSLSPLPPCAGAPRPPAHPETGEAAHRFSLRCA